MFPPFRPGSLLSVFPSTLLVILIFTGFRAKAQNNIVFTSLNTKDGLSSNTVNAILKDRYGLMWFATDDGLNKFDGISFTTYRHDGTDSTTLGSNRITTLYEDKTGNLWVGTDGGYLSIYNRKKDNFRTLNFPGVNNSINMISGDGFGKIWVAHYGGLTVIDPVRRNSFTFKADAYRPDQLSTNAVFTLFHHKNGSVWAGTSDGLFRYNRKSRNFTHYKHHPNEPLSLAGDSVKAIRADSKGSIWVCTTRGLSKLSADGLKFLAVPKVSFGSKGTSASLVHMDIDANDNLWISTSSGLYTLNTQSGAATNFLPDRRNRHSLPSKPLSCVYIDRTTGIYWLGSYHAGVSRYDKNLSLFYLKESNPFDVKSLPASRVTSFAVKNDNEIYVGTDGGGLNVFDRRTQLFHPVPAIAKFGGRSAAVQALATDRNKNLWIGTFGEGLFMMRPNGQIKQFKKGKEQDQLSGNEVFAIKEDSKGHVWIGTNGGGVNVYKPASGTFTKYTANLGNSSPFLFPLNNYIRTIEEDKLGNIWIGSHGSGLAMYNREQDRFILYNKAQNQLENDHIMSILSDRSNNLWVGTSSGLFVLDRKTNRFRSFNERDGLANNRIYSIIEGEDTRLWLSTNVGISSFDRRTGKFKNYNHFNGVQHSNFVLGSALYTPDGSIFFGGLEGMNYFKPSNLKTNLNVPTVFFTDLKISGRTITPSEGEYLDAHISVAEKIKLSYRQNFSLSFVALNYTSPRENLYSYKLEGFDKVWTYPNKSHTASYTNLDPGEYTLMVKARNNDGIWTTKNASIKIIVTPPFWQTTYAYIFYLLAIVALLVLYRHRTLQKLQARFESEREQQELERTRELDNLKIKFITNLSHEFRTPISLILGPIDNLVSVEGDQKKANQLNMIRRNTRRLLNLVNKLLDFRKMEENELTLHLVEGDVVSFVKEVAESFRDLSETKKIKFLTTCKLDGLYTRFDHDKMERILFNLFSNAFKFTAKDGVVEFEVDQNIHESSSSSVSLILKVSDTGIGIPPDKSKKIFERFFQDATDTAVLNQGTGIGLAITREFVKMQGGTIEVESELRRGSTFTVTLPFILLNKEEGTDLGSTIAVTGEASHQADISDSSVASGSEKDGISLLNKPSVLLVEDNEDFRQYLRENLSPFYRIDEASNGKEAWLKALANHPELIVSDINMPVMNGIELTRKVKTNKKTSHMPVILLTALAAEEEQVKGLQTGASDYMTKPFNFEILNAKISNLLALNRKWKDTYTKQVKVLTPEIEIESENAKFLNKVLEYIEQHIADPKLSVEDLSKHVAMSRSTFYNKIMELTGRSPLEFIRNIKLDKAAALIEKSDLTIAQVGHMVGFSSPNYLARSFRAKFGVLPSEYLQMKRKAGVSKAEEPC